MRSIWLIVALVAAFSFPARAQIACGPRERFLAYLGQRYGEQPAAMGVTAAGEVIEVLISPKRSWTIVVTFANGRTCLVSAGEAWERIGERKPEERPRS